MSKKLTVKQQKFADEYIITGNATQAAIKAGYSTKTAKEVGYENLTKPHIKSYIDARLEELKKQSIAEQDEILQFLTSVLRGEVSEKIPLGLGMGEQTLAKKELDGKDRLKAAELLGKRYAMWTDNKNIDVSGAVTFVDDIGEDESET